MAWRIVLGLWAVLATVGMVTLGTGGSLSTGQIVDGIAGLAALLALWGVVKLPWDLYFQARGVQQQQADSRARRIEVSEAEQQETAGLARRLLAVALGLHLLGAGICGAAAWASGGELGLFAAGAFLVSMLLRPTVAMVAQVRLRLMALQRRALLPPRDAMELAERLGRLEHEVEVLRAASAHPEHGLEALGARQELQGREHARELARQNAHHQAELDRLGLEMERALEKLTTDREVIAGLRAFLQMVRAT